MNLENTVTHDWDWWAYQFRVVHRQGITGIEFWDDHLIAFIVNVLGLKPGERLLDLACGSGVHALEFARREIEVVGLDIAPSLVRYCTEQASAEGLDNVTFVEGDMRALTYQEQFDALVILSTSFGFFDDAANQRVLEGIARALKPDGRLLLQLSDPHTFVERQKCPCYWQERPEGIYWTETWFDPVTCISHGFFRFTDNDGVTHLWDDHERVRLYTLPELRLMFNRAGLEISDVYGDILLPPVPYGSNCRQEMIVVGGRAKGDER
ncbi:MAG: methyltransferase domain-containing protein [Chloroflexota bacterium]|nr:methyltransferase domain-containing protein [Chloroflexota bacterium]